MEMYQRMYFLLLCLEKLHGTLFQEKIGQKGALCAKIGLSPIQSKKSGRIFSIDCLVSRALLVIPVKEVIDGDISTLGLTSSEKVSNISKSLTSTRTYFNDFISFSI